MHDLQADSTSYSQIRSFYWQPDSAVSEILGDSLCEIIFAPDSVYAHQLNPLQVPDSTTKLVGKWVAQKELGRVGRQYYGAVQFYLRDSSHYNRSGLVNKCAFAPYMSLSFYKGGEEVILLFNIHCGEVGLWFKDKLQRHEFTTNRYLRQFMLALLPDDEYLKNLEIK